MITHANYHLQRHCSAFQPLDWIETEHIYIRHIKSVANIRMLHYTVIQASDFVATKQDDSW